MSSVTITYLSVAAVVAAVLVALEFIALSHLKATFVHLNGLHKHLKTILKTIIILAMIITILYGFKELHDIATSVLHQVQNPSLSAVSIASKK